MGSRKWRRTPSTLEIPPTLEIPSTLETWILTSGTSGSSSSPDSPTMWEKRIFDEMLATHWTSEGQSKCDEWGSARDLFSVAYYRKEAPSRTRRIKHDEELLF